MIRFPHQSKKMLYQKCVHLCFAWKICNLSYFYWLTHPLPFWSSYWMNPVSTIKSLIKDPKLLSCCLKSRFSFLTSLPLPHAMLSSIDILHPGNTCIKHQYAKSIHTTMATDVSTAKWLGRKTKQTHKSMSDFPRKKHNLYW